jgi:hypothetical protein
MFFFLLIKGSDIFVKDAEKCNVVFWAAYNNNLFLLKFFQRIGMPMNEKDKQGFTPF